MPSGPTASRSGSGLAGTRIASGTRSVIIPLQVVAVPDAGGALVEPLAVIGGQHDDRVVELSRRAERAQQIADRGIGLGERGAIQAVDLSPVGVA